MAHLIGRPILAYSLDRDSLIAKAIEAAERLELIVAVDRLDSGWVMYVPSTESPVALLKAS